VWPCKAVREAREQQLAAEGMQGVPTGGVRDHAAVFPWEKEVKMGR
jgi:hypothetical protein